MKNLLTNESLRMQFQNNFVLTQFAIGLARFMVKRGEVTTLQEVLRQVREHPTEQYLEDLKAQQAAGKE